MAEKEKPGTEGVRAIITEAQGAGALSLPEAQNVLEMLGGISVTQWKELEEAPGKIGELVRTYRAEKDLTERKKIADRLNKWITQQDKGKKWEDESIRRQALQAHHFMAGELRRRPKGGGGSEKLPPQPPIGEELKEEKEPKRGKPTPKGIVPEPITEELFGAMEEVESLRSFVERTGDEESKKLLEAKVGGLREKTKGIISELLEKRKIEQEEADKLLADFKDKEEELLEQRPDLFGKKEAKKRLRVRVTPGGVTAEFEEEEVGLGKAVTFRDIHDAATKIQKFLDAAVRSGTEIRGVHHANGRLMVEAAREFCEQAWRSIEKTTDPQKKGELETEAKRLTRIYTDLEWEYDSIKNLLDYWWKACVGEQGMSVAFNMGIAYGNAFRGAHMKWLWRSYRGREILESMGKKAPELNITKIKDEVNRGEGVLGSEDANAIMGKMIRLGSGLGVKDGAERKPLTLTSGEVIYTEANPGLLWEDWAKAEGTVEQTTTFLYELFKNHALDYYAIRYLRVRHPYADVALEFTGKYDEKGDPVMRDHLKDEMFFAYNAWQYVGWMEKFYFQNLQGYQNENGQWVPAVNDVRISAIGKGTDGEERLRELGWDFNKSFEDNLRELAMFDEEKVIQAYNAGMFRGQVIEGTNEPLWDETKLEKENLGRLRKLDWKQLVTLPGSFYKLKQQLIYLRPGEISNWHEFNFIEVKDKKTKETKLFGYSEDGILGAWAQNELYMQRTRNDLIDFMRGKDMTKTLVEMDVDHFEHIPEALYYIKDREITWWYDGYSRLIWPHLKERRDAGEGHAWVVDMRKLSIQGLVFRGWNRKVRFLGCGIRGIDFNKYPTSIEPWGMVRQFLQGVSEIRLLRDGMLVAGRKEPILYKNFIKYAGMEIDKYHVENMAFNTLVYKEDASKDIVKDFEKLPFDIQERQKWIVLNPEKAEKIFPYAEDIGPKGQRLDFNWQRWEEYKAMKYEDREKLINRILNEKEENLPSDGPEIRKWGDIFHIWAVFKEWDREKWENWRKDLTKDTMAVRAAIDKMILAYPENTIWKKTELGQFYDRELRTIDSFLEEKEGKGKKVQGLLARLATSPIAVVLFYKLGLPLNFWQHEKDAYRILRRQKVGMDLRRPEERMAGPADEILGRCWVSQMIDQRMKAPIIFERDDPSLVLTEHDLENWSGLSPEKRQEFLKLRIKERVGIDTLKVGLVKTMEFCPGESAEISPLFLYHNTFRAWRKLFARMSAHYWWEYAKNRWREKADEAWENYQLYRRIANPVKQWEILKGAANAMVIDEGEFPDLADRLKRSLETAIAYKNEMGSWGVRDIEADKPKIEVDPRYQQAFALAVDELKVAGGPGGLIRLLLGETTFKAQLFNLRNLLAGPFWLNMANNVRWLTSGGLGGITGVQLMTANIFTLAVGSVLTWFARDKGEAAEDLNLLAGSYFGIYGVRERRRKPDVIKQGHTGFRLFGLPKWLLGFEWLMGIGLVEPELHDDTVNGPETIQMFAKSKLELGGAEKS